MVLCEARKDGALMELVGALALNWKVVEFGGFVLCLKLLGKQWALWA